MELSERTINELKKYRYELKDLDTGKIVDSLHTQNAAQKMQALRWKKNGITCQIITTKEK